MPSQSQEQQPQEQPKSTSLGIPPFEPTAPHDLTNVEITPPSADEVARAKEGADLVRDIAARRDQSGTA